MFIRRGMVDTHHAFVVLFMVLLVAAPIAGSAQSSSNNVTAVNATVVDRVALDTSTVQATFEGSPERDRWRHSSDDRAAFYGSDTANIYYYDTRTNTAHTVSRPTGQDVFSKGYFPKKGIIGSSDTIATYAIPRREPVRYTDRGTIAVGTMFGPFVYDLETEKWLSKPEHSMEGHPIQTGTDPSSVVTAGDYYAMTVHPTLYLAPGNWTEHIATLPKPAMWYTRHEALEASLARAIAYESFVQKVGYPLIFRGSVGFTRQPAANQPADWPVWKPPNENLTHFATLDSGPTAVYDGVGSGTVVISGTDVVAYNVTTGKEEWRRDSLGAPTIRRGDTLYMHHQSVNLTTGESTGMYAEGDSVYSSTMGGKEVTGEFDTLDSIGDDASYAALTMRGQSRLGEYRVRGVRVVNLDTRKTSAQRIITGNYQSEWTEIPLGYRVAIAGEYAAIVPPTAEMGGETSVISLKTNETTAQLAYHPGRVPVIRGSEHGLLFVPDFPQNRTVDGTDLSFGRVTGNYTVYDPSRNTTIGHLPVTLSAGEVVEDLRIRNETPYLFTRTGGTTTITEYEGVDTSLTVTSTVKAGRVGVRVTELAGRPLAGATVRLNGTVRTTNESGWVTVTPDAPTMRGTKSYALTVEGGGQTHETTLRVTYAPRAEDAMLTDGHDGPTSGSTPGFGILASLAALLLAVVVWGRND